VKRDCRLSLPRRMPDDWLGHLSFESHLKYVELYDKCKKVLWNGVDCLSDEYVEFLIREFRPFWWIESVFRLYGSVAALVYAEWCLRNNKWIDPTTFAFFYQLGVLPLDGVVVRVFVDKCVYCGMSKLGYRIRLRNALPSCGCAIKRKNPLKLSVVVSDFGELAERFCKVVSRVALFESPFEFKLSFGFNGNDVGFYVGRDVDGGE